LSLTRLSRSNWVSLLSSDRWIYSGRNKYVQYSRSILERTHLLKKFALTSEIEGSIF
jgi:hypothetical protein